MRERASTPFCVLPKTADTPPSMETSGCCPDTPQKSPSVMSLPHLRLNEQERHDPRREAFLRKALMYQSSVNFVEERRGAPSFSVMYSYMTE